MAPYRRCWRTCSCITHWTTGWPHTNPDIPFCRYADDGILHCRTQAEADELRHQLAARLQACGLEMHPEKTRIVYCKDSKRTGTFEHVGFDFLGYTFRPRRIVDGRGRIRTGFTPAVSGQAMKSMRQTMRRWRLPLRSELSHEDLARRMAPRVRGWINYYCRFRGSEFQSVADYEDLARLTKAMSELTAETIQSRRERLSQVADSVTREADKVVDDARAAVEAKIEERPFFSLLAAFGLGLIVGRLLSSR